MGEKIWNKQNIIVKKTPKNPNFSWKNIMPPISSHSTKIRTFSFLPSSFSLEECWGWNWPEGRQESLQAAALVSHHCRSPVGVADLLLDLVPAQHEPGTKKHGREEESVLGQWASVVSPQKLSFFPPQEKNYEWWCFFLKDQCCP